ncbi:MAG: response regulator transcription factor [Deltaproteobacteria bacterium]|nr:response regulator transcription factor [Deltaproteobacteria bacterium]
MPKKSILLVEDDEVIRTMIKNYLEREYQVIVVSRYAEAVKKLGDHIDLALIDYALPDRDGFGQAVNLILNLKMGGAGKNL